MREFFHSCRPVHDFLQSWFFVKLSSDYVDFLQKLQVVYQYFHRDSQKNNIFLAINIDSTKDILFRPRRNSIIRIKIYLNTSYFFALCLSRINNSVFAFYLLKR